MIKLEGKISYTITLGTDGYNVEFEPTTDEEGIKNALAAVSMCRRIAENTLKEMVEKKKTDRAYYNKHYKSIFHDTLRTTHELGIMANGIVDDLTLIYPIPTSKVTIQNEVKEL